jgi:hypothetical protein
VVLETDLILGLALAGATLGIVEGIKPGPLLTMVIRETLSGGLRAGVWTAAAPIFTDGPLVIVSLFAAEILIEDRGLTGAPAVILAALPGLAFAGVVWVFGALIVEEKDEFMRLLHIRQGLIGTGIALTCAAVWGFLETYGFVPHVAAFWWPTIWCFGLGLGALANKIAYGSWGEVR